VFYVDHLIQESGSVEVVHEPVPARPVVAVAAIALIGKNAGAG
jgi:hypothetical protein